MTKAHMAMLAAENKKLEQAGLYRPETIHAAHIVDFTSQDYLGLTRDERILEAAKAALDRYGLGAGGSRVFTGTRESTFGRFNNRDRIYTELRYDF